VSKAEKSGVKNESIMRMYFLPQIFLPLSDCRAAINESEVPVLAFGGRLT
jgi:hypothetical protein